MIVVMQKVLLLFLISILAFHKVAGQKTVLKPKLKYKTFRVGLDPIKSGTWLFKEKTPDAHKFYWRSFQVTGEIIFNVRTSICIESGIESTHRRLLNTTVDYFSEGPFFRTGLNFRMAPRKAYKQYGLGWRVGVNKFTEDWNIRLYGYSWKNELISKEHNNGNTIWGEILGYHIQPLSNSGFFRNILIGADFRIRFMNHNKSMTRYYGEWLPGFGPKRDFSPGLHFRLVYQHPVRKVYSKYLDDLE
jgi:hypothetical protein